MECGIRGGIFQRLAGDSLVEPGQLVDDVDPGAFFGLEFSVHLDNGVTTA